MPIFLYEMFSRGAYFYFLVQVTSITVLLLSGAGDLNHCPVGSRRSAGSQLPVVSDAVTALLLAKARHVQPLIWTTCTIVGFALGVGSSCALMHAWGLHVDAKLGSQVGRRRDGQA